MNDDTAASGTHSHTQGSTGSELDHYHTTTSNKSYFVTSITQPAATASDTFAAHAHTENTEADHAHTVPNSSSAPVHAHTVPNSSSAPVHAHTVPDTSAVPAEDVIIEYGLYSVAGGDALELLINDEKVGEYVGAQSGINITGWISTGHNSVELQPISTDIVKGRAKLSAIATVFLENLK